jgi:tripartite-type tricarboxylate transporter receptor subunit TctC
MRIASAFLFATLSSLLTLSAPALAASADGYPQRPIRVIIPFAPGGGTDLLMRTLQERFDRAFGVSVIVDNRPGGGGTIGFTLAARAAPDGYTLMVTSASYTFAPGLYKDLPFDPINDLRPLSMLTQQPLILGVHPSVPARNVKELLALARQRPKDVFYASAGVGSNLHMTTELFKYMGKINLVQVPYKGGGPALIALVTGEVHVSFMSVLGSKPFRTSGKVRALAVTTKERSPAVPELPTIDEAGVPGYDKGAWTGMLAPAKVPEAIINQVYQTVAKVLKDPEAVRKLADDGLVAVASTPAEFNAFVRAEIVEWSRLAKEMKL